MSHVKNYVHCVWGTKRRHPFFTEGNTRDIMVHIRSYASEKNIWIDHLNAYQNHVHCLISLRADQCLAEVINQIKGESSHWINQHIRMDSKFSWAVDYYASSVSLKVIPVDPVKAEKNVLKARKRVSPEGAGTPRVSRYRE